MGQCRTGPSPGNLTRQIRVAETGHDDRTGSHERLRNATQDAHGTGAERPQRGLPTGTDVDVLTAVIARAHDRTWINGGWRPVRGNLGEFRPIDRTTGDKGKRTRSVIHHGRHANTTLMYVYIECNECEGTGMTGDYDGPCGACFGVGEVEDYSADVYGSEAAQVEVPDL